MTPTFLVVGRFCVVTYLLYGIGYAVPVLQRELQLSESIAGLHASAVAAGLIASGVIGDRVAARLGAATAVRLAVGGLAGSAVLVASAGYAWLSLGAGFALGVFAGVIMSWVNQRLAAPGGREATVMLARANVAALVTALFAPLAIATLDASQLGARAGLLVPLPPLLVIEWLAWRRSANETRLSTRPEAPDAGSHLPRAFWRAWLVLAVAIGIEFSIVFWASSLIGVRVGVDTPQATTAAAAFVVGMIVGRLGLASGIGSTASRVKVMALAFAVVVVGVFGAWQSASLAVSAAALFVAGLGVAPLYPIGIAVALGSAVDAPLAAAARTTFASGTAILVAPFALSVLAEQIGLVNAWPMVALLALAGIALLLARPVPSTPIRRMEPADPRG